MHNAQSAVYSDRTVQPQPGAVRWRGKNGSANRCLGTGRSLRYSSRTVCVLCNLNAFNGAMGEAGLE